MGADKKRAVALPTAELIRYIIEGKTTGEIVAATGSSNSSVKQCYDRVINQVMRDIDRGYDPRRDSNKSRDYIQLREIIRNKRIEEGFKNNLLHAVESMQSSMANMQLDQGGFIEKGKLIEKMHKQIIEIQKISKKD